MHSRAFFLTVGALVAASFLSGCLKEAAFTSGAAGSGATSAGGSTSQGGGGSTSSQGGTMSQGGAGGTMSQGGAGGTTMSGGGGGGCVPKVEDCATTNIDENCDGEPKCTGTQVWSKRFGATNDQHGQAVAVDPSGNVLVAGYFSTGIDFATSKGATDAFVVKLNPDGLLVWGKGFGGVGPDAATAIAADADGNVVVAGTFQGKVDFGGKMLDTGESYTDVFVAKLTPAGDVSWAVKLSTPLFDDTVHGVAVDPSGNVLVTGSFAGSFDVNGKLLTSMDTDIYVAKLSSASGAPMWTKNDGAAGEQNGSGIASDSAGNVIVVGSISAPVDFGTGLLMAQGTDALVLKLSPSGQTLWAKSFGDSATQLFRAVAVGPDGRIFAAASLSGSINFGGGILNGNATDVGVAAFDKDGGYIYGVRYGDGNAKLALSITADGAENATFGGEFDGTLAVNGANLVADVTDGFVIKLDPAGKAVWAKQIGGGGTQSVYGVAADALGRVAVTGYFSMSVDLGGGALLSAGAADVFVGELLP